MLQVFSQLVLLRFVNLQVIHESGVENQLMLEVVIGPPRPKEDLDDVVDHVAVDYEAEAHAEERVDCFRRVVRGNVAVADCGDCVESPIESIEVLDLPIVVEDWRIGSGRIEPAN
jgi:hypothetical protein